MTSPRSALKAYANPEELAEIKRKAASAGLSLSAYLISAGLNHPVRSMLDLNAVHELAKVNGDLGRVAGLLKLFLAEKSGAGSVRIDVRQVMQEFRRLQKISLDIMGEMIRKGGKK